MKVAVAEAGRQSDARRATHAVQRTPCDAPRLADVALLAMFSR